MSSVGALRHQLSLLVLSTGLLNVGRDQVAQTAVDVEPAGVRAVIETFERGNQTEMGEADFGLVAVPSDVEGNRRPRPLGLVVGKVEGGVHDLPDDFPIGNELGDLLLTAVDILVAIGEFVAELVGVAVDLPRPPGANVVDGGEDLRWRGL